MPPLPKLRIEALDELARQLRYAPPETLRRQLERAQELAAEIDPAINYPEEWIVFRITGYRPQQDGGAVFVGEALLADISALVERLSAAARIGAGDLEQGQYVDADALCERWRISRKSLDRYRRRGLVALRVMDANGRARLMFPAPAIARFEARHGGMLEEAGRFSRIPADVEDRIVRRASRYRRVLGWTLNQCAKRIAGRYGRGHETVRQVLRRHDAGSPSPIFTEAGPPDARERELIVRAHLLFIEPGEVAERLGRARASVARVAVDERSARLRTLVEGTPPALGTLPDLRATAACLESAPVTSGLGAPGERDLLALLEAARRVAAPGAAVERARAIAYHFLIERAALQIRTLPEHSAKAGIVDAIETDLRWAARLKTELVRSQLPLLIRTVESGLRRAAEEIRPREFGPLFLNMIRAIAGAVDDFHPAKGGRLAAPAGIALTRIVTRFERLHIGPIAPAKATPRPAKGTAIEDWTLHVAPWQRFGDRRWLEPDPRVRQGMITLNERQRALLETRFGWAGPPRTYGALAAQMGTTIMRIAQEERKAAREAIRRAASPDRAG